MSAIRMTLHSAAALGIRSDTSDHASACWKHSPVHKTFAEIAHPELWASRRTITPYFKA